MAHQSGLRLDHPAEHSATSGQAALSLGQQAGLAQVLRALTGGQRLVLLTGEPGIGKSTVAAEVAAAPPAGFDAVLNGFWWRGSDPAIHFRDALSTRKADPVPARGGATRPLLICDAADSIEPPALAAFAAFIAAEPGAAGLIVGSPGLLARLRDVGVALPPPALATIAPLSRRESDAFLKTRFAARGLSPKQVAEATLAAMHDGAQGNPRRLKALIEKSFLSARPASPAGQAAEPSVAAPDDAQTLRAVAAPAPDLEPDAPQAADRPAPPARQHPRGRRLRSALRTGAAAMLLVAGSTYIQSSGHPTPAPIVEPSPIVAGTARAGVAPRPPVAPAPAEPAVAPTVVAMPDPDPVRLEAERQLAEAMTILAEVLAERERAGTAPDDAMRGRYEDLLVLRPKTKSEPRTRTLRPTDAAAPPTVTETATPLMPADDALLPLNPVFAAAVPDLAEPSLVAPSAVALGPLLDKGLTGFIARPRADDLAVTIHRQGARIRFSYPDLGCAGLLEPFSDDPSGTRFREQVFPGEGCGDAGWVSLVPTGDGMVTLNWAAAPEAPASVTATLTAGVPADMAGHPWKSVPASPEADPELREALMAMLQRDRADIQQRLTLAGFDTKGADGFFGPATRTAIAAWQKARGLAPTGYLDPSQAAVLQAETGRLLARAEP